VNPNFPTLLPPFFLLLQFLVAEFIEVELADNRRKDPKHDVPAMQTELYHSQHSFIAYKTGGT